MSAVATIRKPCLLDTDVLIDYLRKHPKAAAVFDKLPDDCAVCAMSVAELHASVREGAERDALNTLLSSFTLVEVTAEIAAQGGLLRRDWGKSHGVGLNDALIAATALHTGRVLLSLNGKHFPMLGRDQLVVPYKKS